MQSVFWNIRKNYAENMKKIAGAVWKMPAK